MPELVDVVIAARDAATTVGDTLRSLQSQTLPGWRAWLVDDGSVDGTAERARDAVGGDPRLTVVSQSPSGVSAARNAALALGTAPWVLFLDADDWIGPTHVADLLEGTRGGAGLVHTGWYRAAAPAAAGATDRGPADEDLFPVLAGRNAFVIHAALVSRTVLANAGGFDPALAVCEDWDLWQRVARTGVRATRVDGASAGYRTRPGAASADPGRLLAGALVVTSRGHAPDPRVRAPAARHADGAPAGGLPLAQALHAVWAAGLALERGEDALQLVRAWPHSGPLALVPDTVADLLLEASPDLTGADRPAAVRDVLDYGARLAVVLQQLAAQTHDPHLPRRVTVRLATRVLRDHPDAEGPVGPVAARTVDVQSPLPDLNLPEGVDRLLVRVVEAGEPVGTVLLPVVDGRVAAGDVADGIAAELAWPLLGRWFARTTWPADVPHPSELHDRTGWDLLLQQVWDRPGLDAGAFYDPTAPDGRPLRRTGRWRHRSSQLDTLEVADEAAWRAPAGREHAVQVGGALLGTVRTRAGASSTAALRAAATGSLGFELCRAAVREGLLGRPWAVPPSLAERLRERAAEPHEDAGVRVGRPDRPAADRPTQRRTALPRQAEPEVRALAAALGQPVVGTGPGPLRYDPSLLPQRTDGLSEQPPPERPPVDDAMRVHDHFESLFARGADPWAYDNLYEVEKYERTLSLVPGRPSRAVELACAEGHFTVRLADWVDALLATDVSETAVARTAQRCAGRDHVRTAVLDLLTDELPAGVDLVVCSEVLYYLPDVEALQRLGHGIAQALVQGGHLLTAHAHLVVDDPDRTGFDWDHPFGARVISEVLADLPGLRLVRELRTPLYRVCLYVRDDAAGPPPQVQHVDEVAAMPPAVAERVRWEGGQVAAAATEVSVPILMWHRVAETGSDWSRRHRVTPAELRQQLRYLRGEGYRSTTLAEWARARTTRRPLPERSVVLTFDDGYLDLLTEAWPLLDEHGFDASAFLVTDRMGGDNAWDARWGERVPLLTWDEARELERAGMRFGGHTCTHDPLTALDQVALVRDLARSRAALERELSHPLPAIAYPYGDVDPSVLPFVAATGHLHGLTCRPGRSRHSDGALDLPRIEVVGGAGLRAFAQSLRG